MDYVRKRTKIRFEIVDGTLEALRKIKRYKHKSFDVTNQEGIVKDLLS